jgi:hypothetical protein
MISMTYFCDLSDTHHLFFKAHLFGKECQNKKEIDLYVMKKPL